MEFEGTQFITPMTAWEKIGNANTQQKAVRSDDEVELFSDVFHNVINQVYTTQADVENKQYLLSTGQLDNVHTLPIAEAKASLSVDILISLRNKALEAYNDLMKINI
ncbi:MAG: flagellar hook-basal body complex protein FliE [Lachnospiraceae bacterium]|nr:flagellar hook-basal body complex protein FliE [Lachnospiraceae bacterium]